MLNINLAKVLVTACAFFSIASAATYNVSVGSNGLTFDPSSLTGVLAGDTILFRFPTTTRHTATESTYDTPCTARPSGKDSGVITSSSSPATYSVLISDASAPVWFYCSVGSHCASGMVFAVNPTASQTYDAFRAKARGGSGTSPSASASASPSASVASKPPSSGSGGYGSAGVKNSIQKMTVGLAGVGILVGLLA